MAKNDGINPELRDKLIGYKVTQTEKDEIEAYCRANKIKDVSKFIRYSVNVAMARK